LYRIFSANVPRNTAPSDATTPTAERTEEHAAVLRGCPSRRISPDQGSNNLRRRSDVVVFPAPEGPAKAVIFPGCRVRLIPCKISLSGVYLKRTSRNEHARVGNTRMWVAAGYATNRSRFEPTSIGEQLDRASNNSPRPDLQLVGLVGRTPTASAERVKL
jgi:hypothetical protein